MKPHHAIWLAKFGHQIIRVIRVRVPYLPPSSTFHHYHDTFAIAIFNIFLRVADPQYFAGSVSVNNHGSGSSI